MTEPVSIILVAIPDLIRRSYEPEILKCFDELRELYWTTDIPTNELRDAYVPGLNDLSHICQLAGPVKINRLCGICNAELWANSRAGLKRWVDQDWCRLPFRCDDCFNAETQRMFTEINQPPPPERVSSYQEYLQTDHWKERRTTALRRAGFACQVCSGKGKLHVHHRTYARRGRELDTDLIVLCAGCHEMFHINGKLAEGGRAEP